MDYPVMKELARVKEYIIKVRKAENTYKSNMSVDKEAAERFIRHALSDQKKKNIGDDEEMSTAEADAVQGTNQTVSETKKSAEKDTSADGETVTTVSTPTPSSTSVNKKKKAKSK
ncbi:hypothetical protein HK098_003693 [Nowakowskiella sp. JEL0407]|nr:hypothetical protein HK098_003693 [Nowakowskiella sp. JEL0407]